MAEQELEALIMKTVMEVCGPDGPFPLSEAKVYDQTYKSFMPPAPQTLPELYNRCRTPEMAAKPFLVFDNVPNKTIETLTFGEVFKRVDALASILAGHSVVAIAMRNLPEFVLVHMAATSVGCIVTPLNAWWTSAELEYGIVDSTSSIVFADSTRLERICESKKLMGLMADGDLTVVSVRPRSSTTPPHVVTMDSIWRDLLAPGKSYPPATGHVRPDDAATIMYTSGSTAQPKGVLSTHRSILAAINMLGVFGAVGKALGAASGAGGPDVPPAMLLPVPLFHVTASHVAYLACFLSGRKLVMMWKWDAARAIQLIEQHKVTAFTGVPTMTFEILNHPSLPHHDTSTMRTIGGGGAPAPPQSAALTVQRFKKASPAFGYGLTETNSVTTINSGPSYVKYPTSCGRPALNVEIKIMDEGEEQPAGSVGEIWIHGASTMAGYWGKPKATAEVLVKDGGKIWFRSGDIGYLNEEGFLFISDRLKDIIIRGGENISTAEVESALYKLPFAAEVAVVGVPDDRLGEAVAAVVVPKPGHDVPDLAALRSALTEGGLAKFKLPSHLRLWHEPNLPRGATGKIHKRTVKAFLKKEQEKPRSKL